MHGFLVGSGEHQIENTETGGPEFHFQEVNDCDVKILIESLDAKRAWL